jgi:Asp-tRNA(Asn)/Glu-tRNA(Gln) amidotransferase A subunit family amidase
MKKLIGIIFIYNGLAYSQTHADTIHLLQQTATLYDLHFSGAQADSLRGHVMFEKNIYERMHKELPSNDLSFTFAFHPAPYGFKIPAKQEKINWKIPKDIPLPTDKNELAFYSIPQLASLIRSKKISSEELTRFFIARLKKWGETLHCTITITEDTAIAQARLMDEELKKGIYRGPLQGIPYGLKDLFAVTGYRTTWGATPYKDQVINEDAFVYTQLKKAGAVLCAKLSPGELAFSERWFGGYTRNPWDTSQGSAGSSAGSASAVAAGLLPFSIGTETVGSIIDPSTRCGATGLRPTFGTISRTGAMILSWSLDKPGPICRSAEDDAIVYYYLKGTDGKDYSAIDHAFNYHSEQNVKKLRIAYAENYFKQLPEGAMEWEVLETFKKMGVDVRPVTFPDSVYTFRMADLILAAEASAAFDGLTRSGRDSLLEQQHRGALPNNFRAARYIPAVEYINANRYRSRLCEQVQAFMKTIDVLVMPTYAGSQVKITNLTGNPVVCMPMGFDRSGHPQSITFMGKLYDEASVLEAAKAYQDKTEHNKKHPALFRP